ncbi:MAG: MobA/MobL family protein [Gemmiger formicilis]|uniref:MobA/MobL family protein n=1 Tax=Gemmiger formicilis TaxID=745368 RepID=UPI003A159640
MYELDEDGNRIRDADGKFVFNTVPTTDWQSRNAGILAADMGEHAMPSLRKRLDVRIDHRSYESGRRASSTVHGGATVRAMEKKGIRTEKGFNRWIRATNAGIGTVRRKSLSCLIGLPKQKRGLASRRHRPCFSAERLLHPA